MFSDIATTWEGVIEDMSDVKELVCVGHYSSDKSFLCLRLKCLWDFLVQNTEIA